MAGGAEPYAEIDLVHKGLYEQIADQIQGLMTKHELEPGDKVPPERELARMLGVSRPTVREAMRLLRHRGLVTRQPGSGTFVSEMKARVVIESIERFSSLRDCSFADVMEVREFLEQGAARLAATRTTTEDLKVLREIVEAIERDYAAEDREAYAAADARFHAALVQASGNELLTALNASISHLVSAWLAQTTASRVDEGQVKTHREILRAIAEKNADAARELVVAHIQRTLELYAADTGGIDKVSRQQA